VCFAYNPQGADTVIYERLNPSDPQNAKLKGITTEVGGDTGIAVMACARQPHQVELAA